MPRLICIIFWNYFSQVEFGDFVQAHNKKRLNRPNPRVGVGCVADNRTSVLFVAILSTRDLPFGHGLAALSRDFYFARPPLYTRDEAIALY